jgi:hypothetical protein
MLQVWLNGDITALTLGGRAFKPTARAQDAAGETTATLFELDDTTATACAIDMRWAGIRPGTPAGLIVPIGAPGASAKTAAPKASSAGGAARKDE